MKEINIKINKRKLTLLFLGSFVLAFLSVWYVVSPSDFVNIITRKDNIIFIAGIIGSIVFVISSIWIFIKLFDNKSGLIINEKGIIDNSNTGSIGLIKWKDITDIKHKKILSNSLLLIEVRCPQEYLKKATSFKRLSLKQNMSNYGTPIALTSVALNCSFSELERIVNNAFLEYKKSDSVSDVLFFKK